MDVARYNLMRSIDSQYSSVGGSEGAITPRYGSTGPMYGPSDPMRRPMPVGGYVAPEVFEAQKRMAAERACELDNKYLLLALGRLERRRRDNIQPIFGGTHECTFKCDTIESSVEKGLWVCIASGNIHKCHANCHLASTETHSDSVIDICPIAGVIRTQTLIDFEDALQPLGDGRMSSAISDDKAFSEQVSKLMGSGPLLKPDPLMAANKARRVQMAAEYTTARIVMHKLILSEKRRALDEKNVAKCYQEIGERLMKQRDECRKRGEPILVRDISETILSCVDALRVSTGIVCHGHTMSPQATHELLTALAIRAVALWQAFHTHDVYHVTNGLGGTGTSAPAPADSATKPKEQKRLSLEYHVIAMLYKMKTGVADMKRGIRWLPKVDALENLLPNQKDLASLGFKKPDFSKNETSFQTALFNLYRENH